MHFGNRNGFAFVIQLYNTARKGILFWVQITFANYPKIGLYDVSYKKSFSTFAFYGSEFDSIFAYTQCAKMKSLLSPKIFFVKSIV